MIEIINVCKSFDGHKVLDNLNLNIRSGETTVIIGRSGCGKSVLLKHIIGLLKPDTGHVLINGRDITRMDEKELSALEEAADDLGLPHALIVDRGLTQVPEGTVTCLGIGPAPAGLIDRLTGKLKLL